MFDFELAMKVIVAGGAAGLVLVMLGIGIKVIFFRKQVPGSVDAEHLEGLEERVLRAEAKVNELEERLDFTERMLTDVRNRVQLPGS
jgi:hypothetical protein